LKISVIPKHIDVFKPSSKSNVQRGSRHLMDFHCLHFLQIAWKKKAIFTQLILYLESVSADAQVVTSTSLQTSNMPRSPGEVSKSQADTQG